MEWLFACFFVDHHRKTLHERSAESHLPTIAHFFVQETKKRVPFFAHRSPEVFHWSTRGERIWHHQDAQFIRATMKNLKGTSSSIRSRCTSTAPEASWQSKTHTRKSDRSSQDWWQSLCFLPQVFFLLAGPLLFFFFVWQGLLNSCHGVCFTTDFWACFFLLRLFKNSRKKKLV